MRRSDREIKDNMVIYQIIKECDCCRLGLFDDGHVYIVPLNFGEVIEDDSITLYFHSAKEGRKIDLMRKNPKVGFEMDTNYHIKEADVAWEYTARYQSVIGEGTVEFVDDYNEKITGLNSIMKHSTGKTWEYNEAMVNEVCIFKLNVELISGKQNMI